MTGEQIVSELLSELHQDKHCFVTHDGNIRRLSGKPAVDPLGDFNTCCT